MDAMVTRRTILQAGSLAAGLAALGSAKQLSRLGVQLYTVRTVLPEHPLETLRAIEEIGYKEIETGGAPLEKIWPALEKTKLKGVSAHLDSKLVTQGPEADLDRTLADLKQKGFSYAVYPYLPPNERGGVEAIKKLAASLNRAAAKAQAAGLKFAYHNHAFEFEPVNGEPVGGALMTETDPKLVGFEVDCFWVSVAGHDPAQIIEQLSGRVPLLHLKDKAADTPVRYNESVPKATFQEVGHGVIDWPAVLRAADKAGVEHYFVEQDQTPGDPVASLRQSYQFLSKLNY
jgi:sugar phosphate isomerase/epimerase